MDGEKTHLSERSVLVLEMIAAGSTYEQILAAYPSMTYLDIFAAAQESLDAMTHAGQRLAVGVDEVRRTYPRAYEKWSQEEELHLRQLIRNGLSVAQIARRLQRQRSAIRSRIIRLDLVSELGAEEQADVLRISKMDPVNADPSEK